MSDIQKLRLQAFLSEGVGTQATKSAYETFMESVTNKHTRENYAKCLRDFRKYAGVSEGCDELLGMEPKAVEDLLVAYIHQLERRGLASSSVRLRIAAIKTFFVENRAENRINFKWITKRITKNKGRIKDRDYRIDELKALLPYCDARNKAILGLLLSGMRKGAIPTLKIRDLAEIKEAEVYKVVVYADENEEYISFVTPEGKRWIDIYLESRRTAGEIITKDSPVIRNAFDKTGSSKPALPITGSALNMNFARILRIAKVRDIKRSHTEHHEVKLFHGIRKFVNHCFVNSRLEPIKKEFLMGHKPGLEQNYLRPTESELLSEFLKAVPLLLLTNEDEFRIKVQQLELEVGDIALLKAKFAEEKTKREQDSALINELVMKIYQKDPNDSLFTRKKPEPVDELLKDATT